MKKLIPFIAILAFLSGVQKMPMWHNFPDALCTFGKYDIIAAFPNQPGYTEEPFTNFGAMAYDTRDGMRLAQRIEGTNFILAACPASNYLILAGVYHLSEDGVNFIMIYAEKEGQLYRVAAQNVPYSFSQIAAYYSGGELFICGREEQSGIIEYAFNADARTLTEIKKIPLGHCYALCAGASFATSIDTDAGIGVYCGRTEYVITNRYYGMAAAGDRLYTYSLSNVLYIYDVSGAPRLAASNASLLKNTGIKEISARGCLLYALTGRRILVFNAADSSHIRRARVIRLPIAADNIYVNNHIYIRSQLNELYIIK